MNTFPKFVKLERKLRDNTSGVAHMEVIYVALDDISRFAGDEEGCTIILKSNPDIRLSVTNTLENLLAHWVWSDK